MTNSCGNVNNGSCFQNQCNMTNNGVGNYSFVLVLFILLVICGAAFMF